MIKSTKCKALCASVIPTFRPIEFLMYKQEFFFFFFQIGIRFLPHIFYVCTVI